MGCSVRVVLKYYPTNLQCLANAVGARSSLFTALYLKRSQTEVGLKGGTRPFVFALPFLVSDQSRSKPTAILGGFNKSAHDDVFDQVRIRAWCVEAAVVEDVATVLGI